MSNKDEKDKQTELSTDALDKVINPDDKTVKKLDSEHLLISNEKYKIVKDYREGLDLELLEERYSDFLQKYDYIVGDMSYGKLRLRGFYRDEVKKIPIDMRISYLEDYLLEYCSFGCAYFVLENIDPNRKEVSRHYDSDNKSDFKNKQSQLKKTDKSGKQARQSRSKKPYRKKKPVQSSGDKDSVKREAKEKRPFTKKNRNKTAEGGQKKEEIKEVKNTKGKTRFQIRKKKD